jgi:chromosome segregation ATPase
MKRAQATVNEIMQAKGQLQKTLNNYNSIMDGSADDVRKAYQNLIKDIDQCEKKRGDVKKKVEEMEGEAHKFFAEWVQSLTEITSADLKKRSQDRLNQTRQRYGDILSAGREAGAEFEPFIGALRDQVVYLGYDLNPDAVASLKGDAAKVNEQGDKLFKQIDATINTANDYINSLKTS